MAPRAPHSAERKRATQGSTRWCAMIKGRCQARLIKLMARHSPYKIRPHSAWGRIRRWRGLSRNKNCKRLGFWTMRFSSFQKLCHWSLIILVSSTRCCQGQSPFLLNLAKKVISLYILQKTTQISEVILNSPVMALWHADTHNGRLALKQNEKCAF